MVIERVRGELTRGEGVATVRTQDSRVGSENSTSATGWGNIVKDTYAEGWLDAGL